MRASTTLTFEVTMAWTVVAWLDKELFMGFKWDGSKVSIAPMPDAGPGQLTTEDTLDEPQNINALTLTRQLQAISNRIQRMEQRIR